MTALERIAAYGVLIEVSAPDDPWRERLTRWMEEEVAAYARVLSSYAADRRAKRRKKK